MGRQYSQQADIPSPDSGHYNAAVPVNGRIRLGQQALSWLALARDSVYNLSYPSSLPPPHT